MPRIRLPFPAIEGLYAKPTVVNNVETLSTVPHILTMGGAAYAELGVNKSTGVRFRGKATWRLKVTPGRYVYRSDKHKKLRGSFIVSSSGYPA